MTIASAAIPVIDISPANSEAASQLLSAATDNGFVYIENNKAGISASEIDRIFDLSREFFQSPIEIKKDCEINSAKSGSNRGWVGMGVETLDPRRQKRGDFKEAFNLSQPRKGDIQPLCGALAHNRDLLDRFQSSCQALSSRVLRLFSTALDIADPDWFTSRHDPSRGATSSVLRLLYYPSPARLDAQTNGVDGATTATRRDEEDIRAGAHSDYGSITLLFQRKGQPGLEILTKDGEWASVPIDPGSGTDNVVDEADGQIEKPLPILINIGDLLSYWTGDLLKSTVHRVIFPKNEKLAKLNGAQDEMSGDRYSIAYFCQPLDDAGLTPVPSEIVKRHTQNHATKFDGQGKSLTAKEHLNSRLAATYGTKKT